MGKRFLSCWIAGLAVLGMYRDLGAQATPSRPPIPMRYGIDASHSSVGFSVRFMGMSTVRGAFADVEGAILYVQGDPSASSVSVDLAAASINTNSRTRDEHLRSPDFFDVKKYPRITFQSSRITRSGKGFVLYGPLTIRGVTREVRIPFTQLNPPMRDAWGNQRQTFQGKVRISRKAFGVLGTAFWNTEFDPGRMSVSDNVDIDLLVSANAPNPLRWKETFGDSLLTDIERGGVDATMARFATEFRGNPRIDSIPAFAFIVTGEKLNAKGRVADAIRFYTLFLDLFPGMIPLRLLLGEKYMQQREFSKAKPQFEHVLKTAPSHIAASQWIRALERMNK